MPEDTLRVTIDPSNSFDVLQRLGGASDRLGQSGERIGAGFIRGDRAVRVATQNITSGLLSANSAADASLIAFQSLERVFRIPLLATVGVAAGIAGIVKLHEEVTKTRIASEAAGKELAKSFGVQSQLSTADLVSEITAVSTASVELEKRLSSTGQKIVEFFQRQQFGNSDRPQLQAESTALQKREFDLLNASADAQRRVIGLKETQLEQGKDASASAKLLVDYENQIAKIQLNMPFGPPTEAMQKQLDNAKALLNVEGALLGIETSRARQAKILSQQQDTAKQAQDFLLDVGSGKFIKDLAQKRREEQLRQNARQQIAELQQFKDQGGTIGPDAQALLDEADRISSRIGPKTSIQDFVNTDFSNLLELSKYDFSGLQPLSGLRLQIQ